MSRSRLLAGICVLVTLSAVGIALLIPYGKNFQFQNALDDIVAQATTADALQAAAVDRAAKLGLPLRSSDIKVVPRPGGGFQVEAVYLVRVDLFVYAVDLHFHPSAEK